MSLNSPRHCSWGEEDQKKDCSWAAELGLTYLSSPASGEALRKLLRLVALPFFIAETHKVASSFSCAILSCANKECCGPDMFFSTYLHV